MPERMEHPEEMSIILLEKHMPVSCSSRNFRIYFYNFNLTSDTHRVIFSAQIIVAVCCQLSLKLASLLLRKFCIGSCKTQYMKCSTLEALPTVKSEE